jgi:hypothetical protein
MRVEKVVRRGKEFAILPMDGLQKLTWTLLCRLR